MSSKSKGSIQSSKSLMNVKSSSSSSSSNSDKNNKNEKDGDSNSSGGSSGSTIKIPTSNSSSFLYWKQKESSSDNLTPLSSSPSNTNKQNHDDKTTTTNTTTTTIQSKPQTPTKKLSIFSLGKKSGSEAVSSIQSQQQQQQTPPSTPDKKSQSHIQFSNNSSNNSSSNSSSVGPDSNISQTLPLNRMKPERKSIRIFGLELFSGKLEEDQKVQDPTTTATTNNNQQELIATTTTTTPTTITTTTDIETINQSQQMLSSSKSSPNINNTTTNSGSPSKKPTASSSKKISSSTSTSAHNLVGSSNGSANSSPLSSSPTKSSLKQSSKSSISISSNNTTNNNNRKGSTPTLPSSIPNGNSNSNTTSTSLPHKPSILAPKKVSPSLQSTTSNSAPSSGNSSPLSSSPSTTTTTTATTTATPNIVNLTENGGFDDPFKNDVMLADDLDLSKLNSKVKNKAVERLLQLELFTKILSKEIESISGKLINEISQRKEVESCYKELEAKLQIYEARWKRYSNDSHNNNNNNNNSNNNNNNNNNNNSNDSSPLLLSNNSNNKFINLTSAEDEKMKLMKEERESQRVTTLITRIDTLEKKVVSLEQNNRQLHEELHQVHSENNLLNSDKKKKLKKIEKEKEKEREKEVHKHEKQLLKEKEQALKEQKEQEKQKLKDFKRSQSVSSSTSPLVSNPITTNTTSTTTTTNINNNNNNTNTNTNNTNNTKDSTPLSSSFDGNSEIDNEQQFDHQLHDDTNSNGSGGKGVIKKVLFSGDELEDLDNIDRNLTISSAHGYSISSTLSLRKHAAKRISAHISGTKGLFDDELESLRKCVNDEMVSSEEKSKKVKGYFRDYYLDYNDIINEKKTRMRSKSLSKDKEEENQMAPNFIFSNSTGSISGSISTTNMLNTGKEVNDTSSVSSLTSSFDPNILSKDSLNLETVTSPTLSSSAVVATSSSNNITSTSRPTNEKKKSNTGYLTLGRMFKKDDTMSILSDKLKVRKTRDELISNGVLKVSIFGLDVTEDSFLVVQDYFNNTFTVLLENKSLDDLFKKVVDESKVVEFIEKIESKLITNFENEDPYLVATTFIQYLSKLPTPLFSKISQGLISSSDIQNDTYKTSIFRSHLFSLPINQRSLVVSLLLFLSNVSSPQISPITPTPTTTTTTTIILKEAENDNQEKQEIDENEVKEEKEAVVLQDEKYQNLDEILNIISKFLMNDKQLPLVLDVLKYLVGDIKGFDKQQQTPDIVYVQKDNEMVVRAGSFDKIIEKLFDLSVSFNDPDYNYTIFYTYDYYTDSRSLLERFIYYYRLVSSSEKHSLVIVSVAMFWMKIHHNKLSADLAFIHKLKEFVESVQLVPKPQTTFFSYFRSFFQKQSSVPMKTILHTAQSDSLLASVNHHHHGQNKKKESDKMNNLKDNSPIDIYHLGPAIIAQQITSIDNDLLMAIPPSQFLHKAFTKYETSQQFHNMVDKFNEWAKLTVTEILSKEKLVDRANTLSYFIELAKCCVELGNFNAASAIVGGLNHSSITRLKLTWEKLNTKVHQDYERLETLFDMSMNYKNYREELKTTKLKVIPYLGLFPKDLIAIEEGNDNKTAGGLINIEKFRLLYGMIKKIQTYQQPLFNIKASEPIKAYLNQIGDSFIEEKEYYNLSMKFEPRATTTSSLSSTNL